MDPQTAKLWFSMQTIPTKIQVLLNVMKQLTIVFRDIDTTSAIETRLTAARSISEINHRLLAFVSASLTSQPHYPDDVIIDLLFDHLEQPALARHADWVWDGALSGVGH